MYICDGRLHDIPLPTPPGMHVMLPRVAEKNIGSVIYLEEEE
jgi:hypothetical protein